jgi:hypothetical protein
MTIGVPHLGSPRRPRGGIHCALVKRAAEELGARHFMLFGPPASGRHHDHEPAGGRAVRKI